MAHTGAGPVFAASCIRRRWKSLLTLFRVFQLRFQMTARETYWFVSGFLKGWSGKLVRSIQVSFPICCYVCWLSSRQVCSNNLTLKLSAAVFSSCLAAFLGVERRCGSDTTQLHYKQAYILLVARLISPLFHPQRIRTKLTLRLFVLKYWYSKHISSRCYSKLLYKSKSRAFFIPLDASSLGEYFSVHR